MSPLQSTCGCALHSLGTPWVAQRVWPMPVSPSTGLVARARSSCEIFPAAFRVSTPLPFITATPAESYPRYSIRFSPSRRSGVAPRIPIYPMIPHIKNCLVDGLLTSQRLDGLSAIADQLLCRLGRWRFCYHSHNRFRSGWPNVNPSVWPRKPQAVLHIGLGVRKRLPKGLIDRVERRRRAIELVLD